MLHQAFQVFVFLISAVFALTIPSIPQLLNSPSIDLANTTTAPWPPIPVIQPLHQDNAYISITSCWARRNSSSVFSQTVSKDIWRIIDTKFPPGQGRDDEPVTDVDAHIAAVKFHLQAPKETSITLYEAYEVVMTVRSMMERYGPAIAYGTYVKDGVPRASFSFFVEAEVARVILKV